MKSISTLFCTGVLMSALCVAFVACNEEDMEIKPVLVSKIGNDVTDFFEKYSVSLFKFFDEIEGYESVFITINSPKEFSSAASYSVELPYIDFDNYTLVVGSYYTSGGVYLKSHSVDIKPDVMIFNLIYGDTGKGLTAMFQRNFWSLYPKLPKKTLCPIL